MFSAAVRARHVIGHTKSRCCVFFTPISLLTAAAAQDIHANMFASSVARGIHAVARTATRTALPASRARVATVASVSRRCMSTAPLTTLSEEEEMMKEAGVCAMAYAQDGVSSAGDPGLVLHLLTCGHCVPCNSRSVCAGRDRAQGARDGRLDDDGLGCYPGLV